MTSIKNERAKISRQRMRGVGLGRHGYPAGVRTQALALVQMRRAQGIGLGACADELGISTVTLRKWLSSPSTPEPTQSLQPANPPTAASCDASRWRQVALQHAPGPGTSEGRLALVTPGGYRLEGLRLEEAMAVLGRLP